VTYAIAFTIGILAGAIGVRLVVLWRRIQRTAAALADLERADTP